MSPELVSLFTNNLKQIDACLLVGSGHNSNAMPLERLGCNRLICVDPLSFSSPISRKIKVEVIDKALDYEDGEIDYFIDDKHCNSGSIFVEGSSMQSLSVESISPQTLLQSLVLNNFERCKCLLIIDTASMSETLLRQTLKYTNPTIKHIIIRVSKNGSSSFISKNEIEKVCLEKQFQLFFAESNQVDEVFAYFVADALEEIQTPKDEQDNISEQPNEQKSDTAGMEACEGIAVETDEEIEVHNDELQKLSETLNVSEKNLRQLEFRNNQLQRQTETLEAQVSILAQLMIEQQKGAK